MCVCCIFTKPHVCASWVAALGLCYLPLYQKDDSNCNISTHTHMKYHRVFAMLYFMLGMRIDKLCVCVSAIVCGTVLEFWFVRCGGGGAAASVMMSQQRQTDGKVQQHTFIIIAMCKATATHRSHVNYTVHMSDICIFRYFRQISRLMRAPAGKT